MKFLNTLFFLILILIPAISNADIESPWFPTKHLYPTYLADPYELNFHMQLRSYNETSIPAIGSLRWDFMVGAPLILYGKHSNADARHGWQLVFLSGLRAQFDIDNSQDSVAWEGLFGLQVEFRYHHNFAWRFGSKHYSSHVGDEYIERTGGARIQYTREEWRAGIAWRFHDHATFYSDIAYAYSLGNKTLQDYGRVQMGLQYERPGIFKSGKIGWYSALDISAFEEDDWNSNITFQIGFDMPLQDRRWRLAIEYYDGRSQYGEFFQYREKYAGIEFALDI